MKKKYKIEQSDIICYLLMLGLFVLYFIVMSKSVLDFDAGMNFMVSKYLAINGEYATYYDTYVLFDHKIQTGGVVIFFSI